MKRGFLVWIVILVAGCGQQKPTGEWVDRLHERDPAARLEAVKALGERSAEADVTVPAIAEALKDENVFVRRDAARALGKAGPEAGLAVPFLMNALKDKERSVRRAAADALKKIAPGGMSRPMPVR